MLSSKHRSKCYRNTQKAQQGQTTNSRSKVVVVYEYDSFNQDQRNGGGRVGKRISQKIYPQVTLNANKIEIQVKNTSQNSRLLQEDARKQLLKSSQEAEHNEIVPRSITNAKQDSLHGLCGFNEFKKQSSPYFNRLKLIANQKVKKKNLIEAQKSKEESNILAQQGILWKRRTPTIITLKAANNCDRVVAFQPDFQLKEGGNRRSAGRTSELIAKSNGYVPFGRQILKMKSIQLNCNKNDRKRVKSLPNSFNPNQRLILRREQSHRTLTYSCQKRCRVSEILRDMNELSSLKNKLNLIKPNIPLQTFSIDKGDTNTYKGKVAEIPSANTRSKSENHACNTINYNEAFSEQPNDKIIRQRDEVILRKRNPKAKFENDSFREIMKLKYVKKVSKIIERLNCLNNSNINIYDVFPSASLIHHTLQPDWSYTVDDKQLQVQKDKTGQKEDPFIYRDNRMNCGSLMERRKDGLDRQVGSRIRDTSPYVRSKTLGYTEGYSQFFE